MLLFVEKAVEMDPEHAESRYLLGRTLLRLGRREEARRHLQAARKLKTEQGKQPEEGHPGPRAIQERPLR